MKDGEVYQGYLRNETASEIAFLDQSTKEERRVARNLVASMRQIGSLMPDGLEAGLSREEFRDLIAYLSRLGRRDRAPECRAQGGASSRKSRITG